MRRYNEITVLYVSPDGKGDGYSQVRPLSGLNAAFWVVEEMRGGGMLQPIVIRMMGGEYLMSSPLTISNPVYSVTVEPYDESPVIISGGKKITGFEPSVFNGVPCYAAYIEEVKNGTWYFTDLYVNGLRASLTRYPNQGYLYKLGEEVPGRELFAGSKWFIAKKEDIKDFKNINDCIVSFCHYWIDEHSPIESYDKETGRLTLKYRSRFEIHGNIGYYIENVAEQFKNPGEWYLDRPSGMLYYIPRSDEEALDRIEAYAPVTATLVNINGDHKNQRHVNNIRFRGLTFAYTRGDYISSKGVQREKEEEGFASDAQAVSNAGGVVSLTGAKGCAFENCKFRNYGLHGIAVNEGCSNIKISGCEFYDGGAGGIKINGGDAYAPEYTYTYGNTITDNIINRCGRRHFAACGILAMHTFGNDISHNEISDLYYTGISCGWVWGYTPSVTRDNIISYNHIYNLGQGVLSDMGGVYLLGAQPGTVVSNNLIHDIQSKEYGGWALYTDEGSAGILLENNVCYNTSDNGYHQHYGTSNTVRNNIFAFAGKEMLRVSRFECHLSILFENNIIYTKGCPVYGFGYGAGTGENHVTAATVVSANNVLWCSDGSEPIILNQDGFRTLSEVQKYGLEKGSIIADPGFKDPENFDFTLDESSPAFKTGFKKIDLSKVGVRK